MKQMLSVWFPIEPSPPDYQVWKHSKSSWAEVAAPEASIPVQQVQTCRCAPPSLSPSALHPPLLYQAVWDGAGKTGKRRIQLLFESCVVWRNWSELQWEELMKEPASSFCPSRHCGLNPALLENLQTGAKKLPDPPNPNPKEENYHLVNPPPPVWQIINAHHQFLSSLDVSDS